MTHTPLLIQLDEAGFQHIFQQYHATLCAYAYQYVEDSEAAGDLVQDAFAKLWQGRHDFFYLHQIKSFLFTTVHNKALNELEHSKVVSDYMHKMLQKQPEQTFHDQVVEQETYRVLVSAIDQLPTQSRAIMQLALQEKNNHEIAKMLQISPETVHSLKKLAYKKLRISLKRYY